MIETRVSLKGTVQVRLHDFPNRSHKGLLDVKQTVTLQRGQSQRKLSEVDGIIPLFNAVHPFVIPSGALCPR